MSRRLILPLFFFTAALSPRFSTAQQTVTLYDNSSYGGANITVQLPAVPGTPYNLPSSMEDRVTSLRWNLDPGVILVLYTDDGLSGREYTIMHDRPRSGGQFNVGSYYNDKFDSLTWYPVNASLGWVRAYTNTGRGGYQFTRYLSRTGLGDINLIPLGYNDQIDSVEWSLPTNRTVMLHDEQPATGGKALSLINSGYYGNMQNGFGALYHDNISTLRVMVGQFTSAYADRNRPLDKVCQLDSHNAHVSQGQGYVFWYNQNWDMIRQLDYGVRMLELDVRENNNVPYLVHGSWSQTLWARGGTTPETLDSGIAAIHQWLQRNPEEVIFLDFQNDWGSQLRTYLDGCVLAPYLYRPDRLGWPTTNELVALGKRVIIFQNYSNATQLREDAWRVANDYENHGSTNVRTGEDPIDGMHHSMFQMCYTSSSSVPSIWFNSPNDFSTLIAFAQLFEQFPNWISLDGVETAGHGGIEACRFINQALWGGVLQKAGIYPFQTSCNTTHLGNIAAVTKPVVGTGFKISGPSNVFMITGLSDATTSSGSLPAILPVFPGCTLRVALDAVAFNASDTTTTSIPNVASFAGLSLYFQAAAISSANGGLYTSNGIRADIGF